MAGMIQKQSANHIIYYSHDTKALFELYCSEACNKWCDLHCIFNSSYSEPLEDIWGHSLAWSPAPFPIW